jgi:single-strand DNA-binding protein
MIQGFMVGRIGKDAELRSLANGTKVSNFSLAVTTGYGDREKTLWIDCSLWEKAAEALNQYLTKGKQVAVLGELDIRTWDSKDGTTNANIQLSISKLTLCGSPEGKS